MRCNFHGSRPALNTCENENLQQKILKTLTDFIPNTFRWEFFFLRSGHRLVCDGLSIAWEFKWKSFDAFKSCPVSDIFADKTRSTLSAF